MHGQPNKTDDWKIPLPNGEIFFTEFEWLEVKVKIS